MQESRAGSIWLLGRKGQGSDSSPATSRPCKSKQDRDAACTAVPSAGNGDPGLHPEASDSVVRHRDA